MERRTTPDLLGSLMSGTPSSRQPIQDEGNRAISIASNKAIKPASNRAIKQAAPIADEETKEKATFNLPVVTLKELEDQWMRIRQQTGSKQISKTLIVEAALALALAEYDKRGQDSSLYCLIANQLGIKQ